MLIFNYKTSIPGIIYSSVSAVVSRDSPLMPPTTPALKPTTKSVSCRIVSDFLSVFAKMYYSFPEGFSCNTFCYCPFHKTLPRSSAFLYRISVRFYETDCISSLSIGLLFSLLKYPTLFVLIMGSRPHSCNRFSAFINPGPFLRFAHS